MSKWGNEKLSEIDTLYIEIEQQLWCLQEPSIGMDDRPFPLETSIYHGLQRNIRGITRVNLVINMKISLRNLKR